MEDRNMRGAPQRHEHEHAHTLGADFPIELKVEIDEITVARGETDWAWTLLMVAIVASFIFGATTAGFMSRVDCALGVREACEKIAVTYRTP